MTSEPGPAGPRDPAHDAIATLVVRGLSGPLRERDAAELDRLLDTVPDGRAFADGLVDRWTLAGIAGDRDADERIVTPEAPAVDAATPSTMPGLLSGRRLRFGAFAAAALAVVACGGLLATHIAAPGVPPPVLIAATSEPMTTTLDDGSKVSLSRDGKVLVQMERHHRILKQIDGEAYYEVAKDHSRPFTVEASGYRVTALGTRFNVAPDPSGLHIDLLAGRLRIETDRGSDAPIFLAAGQRFVGGAHPRIEAADPTAADWRSGRLVFNDEPLSEVAQRLSRYSGRRVGIRSRGVGELRFSGVLRWDVPDDWGAAFEATLPVAIEQAPDGIEIVARPA